MYSKLKKKKFQLKILYQIKYSSSKQVVKIVLEKQGIIIFCKLILSNKNLSFLKGDLSEEEK